MNMLKADMTSISIPWSYTFWKLSLQSYKLKFLQGSSSHRARFKMIKTKYSHYHNHDTIGKTLTFISFITFLEIKKYRKLFPWGFVSGLNTYLMMQKIYCSLVVLTYSNLEHWHSFVRTISCPSGHRLELELPTLSLGFKISSFLKKAQSFWQCGLQASPAFHQSWYWTSDFRQGEMKFYKATVTYCLVLAVFITISLAGICLLLFS